MTSRSQLAKYAHHLSLNARGDLSSCRGTQVKNSESNAGNFSEAVDEGVGYFYFSNDNYLDLYEISTKLQI